MRITSNRCHFCFNGWSNVYIGQNFEISVFYNSQDKKWKQWIWSTLDLYANLRNIHRMTFTKLSTKNIMTLQFHLHDICRLLILYVIERYAKLLDNEDSLIAWVIRRTIVADGTLNITWGRVPKWNIKFGNTKYYVRVTSEKIFFGHNSCHFITEHVQNLYMFVVCLGICLFHGFGVFVICFGFFFLFLFGFFGLFLFISLLFVFFLTLFGIEFSSKVFILLAKYSQACLQ